MKLSKSITKLVAGVVTGFVSGSGIAGAADHGLSAERYREAPSAFTYTNPAFNQAIHGYRGIAGIERAISTPRIVYVNQAYGPAIYSYPRVSRDTVAAFNLYYVDQAYGPAIHSYPGLNDARGEVEILPVVAE